MSVFELETFVPANADRTGWSMSARDVKAIEDAAFSKGYKAGVAASNAGIAAEQNRYLAAIKEAISDQRFDFEQAAVATTAAVSGLVEAVANALAPDILNAHFQDIVLHRLRILARTGTSGSIVLSLPPDAVDEIRRVVLENGIDADVQEDPNLGAFQARLAWAAGMDNLDFAAARSEVQAAFAEYLSQSRELTNERSRSA